MYNELLKIGSFTIYGYGLMIAIGIISGYWIAEYRAKRSGLLGAYVFPIAIWCIVGGIIGSKILFAITQWDRFMSDPWFLLNLTDGYVVYGCIIGGIIAGYIYCHIKNLMFLAYFDLFMPSLAIGQFFGRLGCFLAGCCYGVETDSHFGIIFTHSDYAPNGVSLVPIQLIASGLDLILFFVLIIYSRLKKSNGQVGALYLILYSAGRFILEFYRGDIVRGQVGILSTSQFISIFTFALGIIMFIYLQMQRRLKLKI